MAITDTQKVDLLYKKIGFGVAKTDTSAFKSPSNEANASPLLTRGDSIWVESASIPAVKPASNSSVLVLYQQSLSSAIECILDATVSGTNRTWLTNYIDWIPVEFGPTYQVKVYAAPAGNASPETYGTQLFADGSGNNDAWYFDYQAGILNFADTNVPTAVTGKKIYITGARYTGLKGISALGNLNIGNLSVDNFSTNNAAIQGGFLSNIANITAVTANLQSMYSALLNITTANIFNAYLGNVSTANAVINGGYIASLSNITTTTGNVVNWYAGNINSTAANLTTATVTNFSTGNAVISGGAVSNISAQVNDLSSANVLLSGGYIYNVNIQANNFSTANALITGGVLYNIDIQANNFSTANVLITGGEIANTNAQLNNFSSANVLVSGGTIYNTNIQANNFSTANALITGGNVAANISGNVTGSFADFSSNVNANWFVGNLEAGNANFSSLVFANSNLTVSGNLVAAGNVITQAVTSPSGDLYIRAGTENANNIVIFDSISAFLIPSGTTAQRPGTPSEGYVRFNTDTGSIEWWTGLSWTSSNQSVNYQTIVPDGVSASYTLDQESSEAGILVSINGTTQQPGTSYTISGGTTITFSEVPLTSDIIEIRFLSAGLVAASYTGGNVSGNVNILATTVSSSTTTGALTVAGGTGIVGNVNIGGNIGVSATAGTPSNTVSPASWLRVYVGGTAYYLPLYQ